jgi:diguanylate cyclase (GGDEF)-like protein
MQVAEVLQSTLRSTELIARYGGDEFVVLMPSTNLQGAQTAAERLLQAVSGTRFSTTAGQPELSITLSIGIAAYPETTEDPQQLLELADSALEKAKRTGRNRAVALENTA